MKRAIIFGIAGQDGFYLKALLISKGIECIGVSRSAGDWLIGDVGNRSFTEKLIIQYKPAYIFHLAANSTTRYDALLENHETITTGSLHILDTVHKHSRHSKVFLSGSGLQFINSGQPISETDHFDPNSAYSVSRIHSVYVARFYRSLGIQVYVGYFFNHDSPLRSERHVNQKIVQAAKRIAGGSKEMLELGDVSVRKEFTFAGDSVNAIFKLTENDELFESVIGSGKAYSILEWVRICFDHFGLDWNNYLVQKEDFKSEYNILVSDPKTLFSLGWQQQVDIHALAKLMITGK